MAQDDLLQDVFEQVNLAVALDQLLHGGAELLELRRRQLPQAGEGEIHQRQLGVRGHGLHVRQHAERFLADGGGGRGGQLVELLAAHGFVVAQQQRIDQGAGAEPFARGGLQARRDA